jgi:hypothetical protein
VRAWLTDEQTEHDRGIKPDGHAPIPSRHSGGCRASGATSRGRTGAKSRPRTSRVRGPSGPRRSPFPGAGAPPRPWPPGRGRAPCRGRRGEWPDAWR